MYSDLTLENIDEFLKKERICIEEEKKRLAKIRNYFQLKSNLITKCEISDQKENFSSITNLNDITLNKSFEERKTLADISNCSIQLQSDIETKRKKISEEIERLSDILNKLQKKSNAIPKITIRLGEFSPLNPAFHSFDKCSLGLGEYEEQRRKYLEIRKYEQQQYMPNIPIRNIKGLTYVESQNNVSNEIDKEENLSFEQLDFNLLNIVKMPRDIFSLHKIIEEDNISNRKLQQEWYRNELMKQIEEKKRIAARKKAEEQEQERKIEERVRKEEEKLRLEYEKEQADKAQRAFQKMLLDEKLHESLRKAQKEIGGKKFAPSYSSSSGYSVISEQDNLKLGYEGQGEKANRIPQKMLLIDNVSKDQKENISSHSSSKYHSEINSCVYKLNGKNYSKNALLDFSPQVPNVNIPYGNKESIIVDAPYILATNSALYDEPKNQHVFHSVDQKQNRSTSPVIPALKTRTSMNSLLRDKDHCIPSAISISKQTKKSVLPKNHVFTKVAEIRKIQKSIEKSAEKQKSIEKSAEKHLGLE